MKKDKIIFEVNQMDLIKKIKEKKLQGPLGGSIMGTLLICRDLLEGNERIAQHNAHAVMKSLKEWVEEK